MIEPIWGGRNGGISKILEEGAPLSRVWDKIQEAAKVAAIPTITRNVMHKAVTSVPYSGANMEDIKIIEIDMSNGNAQPF